MKFFAMALAAVVMFSCSKEDVADNATPVQGKAQVTVKITGQGEQMKSRAAAAPDDSKDVKVNDYIIFLFNDGGGLIGTPKYVSGSGNGTVDDATTAATKIYIVANTGAIADGPFAGVTSEAGLKACAGRLIKSDASTQHKENLWMVGTGSVGAFTPGADKDAPSTASATVALSFLSARIDVIIKDERINNVVGEGKISIKDDKVALLFAGAEGKFFATPANQVIQTSFFSGFESTISGVTLASVLADGVTTPFTANAANKVEYHFYTFGNAGATMPTILTIQSTRTNADASTKAIYYPVQFSNTDAGVTIVPGNKYTVTLTLKGDVGSGGGGGTTNPRTEVKSAEITVTVTPASWTPKTIAKEFN